MDFISEDQPGRLQTFGGHEGFGTCAAFEHLLKQ